jgi:hypothetical protein
LRIVWPGCRASRCRPSSCVGDPLVWPATGATARRWGGHDLVAACPTRTSRPMPRCPCRPAGSVDTAICFVAYSRPSRDKGADGIVAKPTEDEQAARAAQREQEARKKAEAGWYGSPPGHAYLATEARGRFLPGGKPARPHALDDHGTIFAAPGRHQGSGVQVRTNELSRLVHRNMVRRAELASVAHQHDFMNQHGDDVARTYPASGGNLCVGPSERRPACGGRAWACRAQERRARGRACRVGRGQRRPTDNWDWRQPLGYRAAG